MKTFLYWLIAIVVTIGAAVFQKKTGPTYPAQHILKLGEERYELSFIRSHGGREDCPLSFSVDNSKIGGEVQYRRFPTNDEWETISMKRKGELLTAKLPWQPPAGKVEYRVQFLHNQKKLNDVEEFHHVVRYKGEVDPWILIPHIFFIFFAMMLSNVTAIYALAKHDRTKFWGGMTLLFLTLGGMIFGPWVQLQAFGDLWTGVPFGWDLTDNKTLIAFLAWGIAVYQNRKEKKIGYFVLAAIVVLVIFSIPHSMFGSELDYASGTVTQG